MLPSTDSLKKAGGTILSTMIKRFDPQSIMLSGGESQNSLLHVF